MPITLYMVSNLLCKILLVILPPNPKALIAPDLQVTCAHLACRLLFFL